MEFHFKEGDQKMRTQFVECKDRRTAKNRCPWAAKVVKAFGGFICFESIVDFETWKNQK